MNALLILLLTPFISGALLALFGHTKRAAEINAAGSLVTLLAAAPLAFEVVNDGPLLAFDQLFFVDPLNVFLILLTAFVGFTTALFSRPYMRNEHAHGRLSSARLRLYHSMFQLFMGTMLVALSTNNIGILWVAMEAATLIALRI